MKVKKASLMYLPLQLLLASVARLPFGALYRLADLIYVLVYYIARYRRKTVLKNLKESFPEKNEAEITNICREFYSNFADYIVETIKLGHVTNRQIMKRMEIVGIETVDRLFSEGRSIIMMFSHCFNWEWATSITLWSRFKPSEKTVYAQVYRHLDNDWFNNYFLKLRSRFGSVSFDKRMVLRNLVQLRRQGIKSITGFMSDQKPSHGDTAMHVVNFLNHPTAMITGTEILARKLDMAVLYWDVEKPARGHYRLTVRLLAEHPGKLPEFSITDQYASLLENTIRRTPSIWLWTHKRWKNPVKAATLSQTAHTQQQ